MPGAGNPDGASRLRFPGGRKLAVMIITCLMLCALLLVAHVVRMENAHLTTVVGGIVNLAMAYMGANVIHHGAAAFGVKPPDPAGEDEDLRG